ncbi:MAG: thiamine biosynthesis protein ApbE, partial [Acidobacteriaceae bacterium]|nr:thiamine biosynthesis protein ApbE [Acidobacteriaceae bacterium]
HHGPIDLTIEAAGHPLEVRAAYEAATIRFATVLEELCQELPFLRSQTFPGGPLPDGRVAKRMVNAVSPFSVREFITPMAAVAGSVAEEILEIMTSSADLRKAFVNNGGDIALYLAPGENISVGMVQRPDELSLFGTLQIGFADPVRGIATSGWRGRSFSLGIADAVTVLAATSSMADAAATVVANAVDLPGHPKVLRVPACEISPDSDLGHLLVTQNVGRLNSEEIDIALNHGRVIAHELIADGRIRGAALHLQGETRVAHSSDYLPYSIFPGSEMLPMRNAIA